ncbi:MAG: pyridoxine 5'-phosphate synthase, partial [Deltaproteobacteria bacterium]|nr:pyridoxine 5'-phosphate synthase [Deltaproteobacteria bacterium]
MKRLGVNIDHIATLRQARKIAYPDPIQGALIAQQAGADQITCHLREDRRHIQDLDVERLKESLKIPLNLEMAATSEMLRFASRLKPTLVTLVPEKREELTTEGGLELFQDSFLKEAIQSLKKDSIRVSLFINPDLQDIDQAMKLGACEIELHTGSYAEVHEAQQVQREFLRLQMAA